MVIIYFVSNVTETRKHCIYNNTCKAKKIFRGLNMSTLSANGIKTSYVRSSDGYNKIRREA